MSTQLLRGSKTMLRAAVLQPKLTQETLEAKLTWNMNINPCSLLMTDSTKRHRTNCLEYDANTQTQYMLPPPHLNSPAYPRSRPQLNPCIIQCSVACGMWRTFRLNLHGYIEGFREYKRTQKKSLNHRNVEDGRAFPDHLKLFPTKGPSISLHLLTFMVCEPGCVCFF